MRFMDLLKCPFCSKDLKKELDFTQEELVEHLIVLKNSENKYHIHGPNKTDIFNDLAFTALKETNFGALLITLDKDKDIFRIMTSTKDTVLINKLLTILCRCLNADLTECAKKEK